MNIYTSLSKLARSIKWQNLFIASKEVGGIRLFNNKFDLSNIQSIFLSYLYTYDSIQKDIMMNNVSEHVLDDEIYTDSYLYWKRQTKNKDPEQTDNKVRDLNLVAGTKVNFKPRHKKVK